MINYFLKDLVNIIKKRVILHFSDKIISILKFAHKVREFILNGNKTEDLLDRLHLVWKKLNDNANSHIG